MKMNWKDRKVLITGAGGFIASHLVERLVADGAQVRAFVRYNSRGDLGLLRFLPLDVFFRLRWCQKFLLEGLIIHLQCSKY